MRSASQPISEVTASSTCWVGSPVTSVPAASVAREDAVARRARAGRPRGCRRRPARRRARRARRRTGLLPSPCPCAADAPAPCREVGEQRPRTVGRCRSRRSSRSPSGGCCRPGPSGAGSGPGPAARRRSSSSWWVSCALSAAVAAPPIRTATSDHQRDDGEDQPRGERGEERGASAQPAGLRTYPAPRIVWIIGARPASIFLRR